MYRATTVSTQRTETVGFRCSECGEVKDMLWGDICDRCRQQARQRQELRDAIRARLKDGNKDAE